MTVRYGILSTAQVVPRFVQGIKESQTGVVVAIASRELMKAQKMAAGLNIPKAYGSYEELCRDQEIDIVYIATYNQGHYAAAKLALEHAKHVLLEKPFTLKWPEAKKLFELAEKNNCFLMEAQKSVFLPVTQQLKKRIEEKQFGKLHWIQSITSYPNIDHVSWFRSLAAGGGTLHGSGSYPLEYIQYLTGMTIEDYSGTASFVEGSSDSQSNLSLRLGDHLLANLFITVDLALANRMILHAEKARIEIPNFWKTKEAMIYYPDGHEEKITSEFGSEFRFEVDHVNHCIESKQTASPVMTKELTLTTVLLVEKMYKYWLSK